MRSGSLRETVTRPRSCREYKDSTLGLPDRMFCPVAPCHSWTWQREKDHVQRQSTESCCRLMSMVMTVLVWAIFPDGIKWSRNVRGETAVSKSWQRSPRRLGEPADHVRGLTLSGGDREGRQEGKLGRRTSECHSGLREVWPHHWGYSSDQVAHQRVPHCTGTGVLQYLSQPPPMPRVTVESVALA